MSRLKMPNLRSTDWLWVHDSEVAKLMKRRVTRLSDVGSKPRNLVVTYLWLILTLTTLTVATTFAVVLSLPASYTASAQVVVQPDMGQGSPVQPDMGTEREILTSGLVARDAASRLGESPAKASSGLSAEVPVDTNVLNISYTAATADEAYRGADAFTEAYVTYRNKISSTPVAEVITPPSTPSAASRPNFAVIAALALLLGALVGLGVAFLWDRVRDKLRGDGDVRRHTGLPVLASLPRLRPDLPLSPSAPTAGVEPLTYLAAHLMTNGSRDKNSTLLVTSPAGGAGTTTVAAHLSIALAGVGKDVVLIGGDLRRPRVHEWFGVKSTPGLRDVLDDFATLGQGLRATPFEGLRLLPCGTPTQPGGDVRFNLDDLYVLLGRLSSNAIVVIDAPSILAAPETALLADRADEVILVIDRRRGRRRHAEMAVSALSSLHSNLIGTVTNVPRSSRSQRSASRRRSTRVARKSYQPPHREAMTRSRPG